ncbi:MAG: pyridoxamine 5'-phosphate oxidase family protein [Candidatus Moranbacteria bacterium]|nr:pyridoxamine 5'-phosphate oxidase family protein [Candidatus Moranbacteria bacterium]
MEISKGLKKFIESNAIGLATVNKNGKPHNIAVAYVKVLENKLVISNAHIKESIKNIEQNQNVSLVVWNKEWEKACVGFELAGKAKNYTSGKWFEYVSKLPDNDGYVIKSAVVVSVSKIKKLES